MTKPKAAPSAVEPENPAEAPQTTSGPEVVITPPEIRRGPGRPRKDGTTSEEKPSGASDVPPSSGAKRGRKPGSGKKKTYSSEETGMLGQQIVGLHAMMAMMSGIPELAIADKEGEVLAKGVIAVAEEYGLEFGGKTGAAIQLFAAAAMVYVPRLIAVKQRVAAAQAAQENARVIDGTLN